MRETKRWSRLDNAAKIFPPNSSRRDTKVFRFFCELREPVEPAALQRALEKTVESFPIYRSTLKKGMFWYYFEDTDTLPPVAEETTAPCAPLYDGDRPGPLFRVLYYGCRINLELHHTVADGAGALQFLRSLVLAYLAARRGLTLPPERGEAPLEERRQDAFFKYYDRNRFIPKGVHYRAYRLQGERLPGHLFGVTEGFLSVSAVLEAAHAYGATLSEFLVAQLICAVREGMAVRDRPRPVVVSVPVDLRRFFPVQTARNFFSVIHVAHHATRERESFEQILATVRAEFARQLTQENMEGLVGRYAAIENRLLVRAIPLQIKIPALRLAGWWKQGGDTVAFSNLGRVTLPPEAAAHVRLIGAFLSTKRPQICLCTFGDTLVISLSSPLAEEGLQRRFFRGLTARGIPVQIVSNLEELAGEEEPHATL